MILDRSMGSSAIIEMILGTLDSILSQLMPEQDVQKIQHGLREFEQNFNNYCKKKAKANYSLFCKDENGCESNCIFFKRFIERGLPEKLQELERRGDFYTHLGPW